MGLSIGLLSGCEDEETIPTIETKEITEISATTALAGGIIKDQGSHPIVSQGVCYSSVNTHPIISDNCLEDETLSESFQLLVENLEPDTKYYLRAYAKNEVGVSYGAVVEFTTIEGLADVETLGVEDITHNSALAKAIIHDEGDSPVISRGICYATDSLFPNLESNCIEAIGDDNPFEVIIDDLSPETNYYLKAYAVNEIDSAFGKTKSFETLRDIPKVETLEPENIEASSALVGGEIINPGASNIINQGVCYSQENSDPDFDDTCLYYEGDDQIFQILMEDLDPVNQYHVRAFAENDIGYHFGESYSFTTKYETVTDIDGNEYRILEIGEQVWMIDNLRTTRFSNGDPIPLREENHYWAEETALSEPAYCWYNNDDSYADPYGALYNFEAAADPRNVCPDGWRVMDNDDRKELIMGYLGGSAGGGDLKTTGTIEDGTGLWYAPNVDATNESGFSAIPAGLRHPVTGGMGYHSLMWSSTSFGNSGIALGLAYNDKWAITYYYGKQYGFSIRCVME